MAFPTGWQRKCKLTIQNGKIDDTLSYFPVLVTETTLPQGNDEIFDADGSHPAQNGGGDIRFSSDAAGSSQLACEIVTFTTDNTPANGKAEIWVKVPSIASGTDTDIYIWWETAGSDSQPAEDAAYGKEDVWDDGGNDYFKMVQHLNEDPTPNGAQAIDSTQYDNDGTSTGTMATEDLVTGAFAGGTQGKGWDFDGSDDIVDIAAIDFAQPLTMSAWANTPTVEVDRQNILGRYYAGYRIEVSYDNARWNIFTTPSGNHIKTESDVISVDTWYYLALTYDGSTYRWYRDGSEVDNAALDEALDRTNSAWQIGAAGNSNYPFSGIIDEVRISNAARAAAWIKAEYENQNDPNAFIVEGTPEAAVGIDINFATNISSQTDISTIDLPISRLLASTITAQSLISEIILAIARHLATSVSAETSISNIDAAILRKLSTAIAAATNTSGISFPVQRQLASAIGAVTNLSDITLIVTELIEFASSITAATNVSDIALVISRTLASSISTQSSTSAITLAVLRNLASTVNSSTNISEAKATIQRQLSTTINTASNISDIDITRLIELSSSIETASTIAEISLIISRTLSSTISAQSNLSDITLSIEGLIRFATSVAASTNIADILLAISRTLATEVQTDTGIADISLVIQRFFASDISAGTAISDIDLENFVNFVSSISSTTSVSDITLQIQRLLATAASASADSSAITLQILRQLVSQIDAATSLSDIALITAALGIIIDPSIASVTPVRTFTSITPVRTFTSLTPVRTIEAK